MYLTELGEGYMEYIIVGIEEHTLAFFEDGIHF